MKLMIAVLFVFFSVGTLNLTAQTPLTGAVQSAVQNAEKNAASSSADSAVKENDQSILESAKQSRSFFENLAISLDTRVKSEKNGLFTGRFLSLSILVCGLVLAIFLFSILNSGILFPLLSKDRAKHLGHSFAMPLACFVLLSSIYISLLPCMVTLTRSTFRFFESIYFALLTVCVSWCIYRSVDLLNKTVNHFVESTENNVNLLLLEIIQRILKVVIVVLTVMFIGQNVLHMDITTLLAGAGVIGLAVAFAAQDSIANFFGSIMLVIDKPFNVNDFVKVDGYSGTVVRVGLRSTRIRTLEGHLITLPNKAVAGVPVENVTERPHIKNIINLGLTYDTSPEQMERALEILHEILDQHEGCDPELPPKISFTEFKDFSLNIEAIVWFHPGDFMLNRTFMTKINLEILKRFNAAGLDFAFPTNTTYLAYDQKRRVSLNITHDA